MTTFSIETNEAKILPNLRQRPFSAQPMQISEKVTSSNEDRKLSRERKISLPQLNHSQLQSLSSRVASKSFWNISMLWERERNVTSITNSESNQQELEEGSESSSSTDIITDQPTRRERVESHPIIINDLPLRGRTNSLESHPVITINKRPRVIESHPTTPPSNNSPVRTRVNSLESHPVRARVGSLESHSVRTRINSLESRPVIISCSPPSSDPFKVRSAELCLGGTNLPKKEIPPPTKTNDNPPSLGGLMGLTQSQQKLRKQIHVRRTTMLKKGASFDTS